MRANLRVLGVTATIFVFLLGNPSNVAAVDFAVAKSYPAGTSPAGIAVGDFNGDGKVDMAVADTSSGNVSILLGNGDGTFQLAVNVASGCNPSAIAVGDFNGDGKLDLAAFQPGKNGLLGSITILLGNGDGTFQPPKKLALDAGASVMVVADFNLDKKSDLAVGDQGRVDIFIGNGDGTFQTAKSTPIAFGSADVMAVADFNGDSKPDLAVTFLTSGAKKEVQILLGSGDGAFVTGATLAVAGASFAANATLGPLLIGDFNQDGKADLLIGSSEPGVNVCGANGCSATFTKISVFLGNGDGSFQTEKVVASATTRTRYIDHGFRIDRPFMGDFNGDGKLDLLYRISTISSGNLASESLDLRLGKGDGTFSSPFSSGLENVQPLLNSIALAQNLEAGKLTDLIALGTANDIDVLLNTSSISGADLGFLSSTASPEPVGTGRTLTYTADVLNQGPQDASGVTFKDTLPNNVNFVSATASQGSCVQSNGIVSCNVGALTSANEFSVTIIGTPTVAGTVTNSMNVTANETDPNPTDNTAAQTSTVIQSFTLTVATTGNGSGTVRVLDHTGFTVYLECRANCSVSFLSGTVINVNEIPDANSAFGGWSGACAGTPAWCAFTMSADKTVTANFVIGEKLSVGLAGSGSGSVTSKDGGINCTNAGGNCSSLYAPSTSVSLTALPIVPSVFGGWNGGCSGSDPNTCTVTMNSVQSVTATFSPPPPDFTLTPASTTFTTQTGAQVTDALTLTGQNAFSGAVTLTCAVTGPAPMATCNVSPSSVTLGSNPGSSTLTITAPSTLAAVTFPQNQGEPNAAYAVVLPFPALLLGVIGLVSRKSKWRQQGSWLLGGILIMFLAAFAGCGGGAQRQISPQSYTVTVTATSGSVKHSTMVNLTVQ